MRLFANNGDVTMCYAFDLYATLRDGDVLKQHRLTIKHFTKFFMKDQTIPTLLDSMAFTGVIISRVIVDQPTNFKNSSDWGVLVICLNKANYASHHMRKKKRSDS